MQVEITPKAVKYIKRMIRLSGASESSGFRLALKSGGCAGFSYDFTVQHEPEAEDAVVQCGDIKLFVPKDSQIHLDGVIIDAEDNLMRTGLVFKNPNAGATCGCGTSFAPKAF
jgi:iron-sulfur cluster assembly accessory protein